MIELKFLSKCLTAFLDVALIIALFPNIFPYAKNINLSLKEAMAAENVLDLFKLPMTC